MNKFFYGLRLKMPINKSGFTLTEVMITVAIITLLATVTTFSWREISRRAQATKIASDFKKIESSWQLWRADTHSAFPDESVFDNLANPGGSLRTDAGIDYCNEESFIGETVLFSDNSAFGAGVVANWHGPYLNQEIVDPWRRRYMYDNDGDAYQGSCGTYEGGANIQLAYCPAVRSQYEQIASIIDQTIDGTSTGGECTGKFRWSTTSGTPAFLYLLDEN